MERRRAEVFSEEVERYRKALLYYARACDWETFKAKAGKLFDFLESTEMSEIQRRFYRITRVIVVVLALVVLMILKVQPAMPPEMEGLRKLIILSGLSISSFELYFFLNFKRYLAVKTVFYNKRRENFIAGIEQDFKTMVSSSS